MNLNNEKEEKKGGFISALFGLFRGGSAVGGASSGLGSAAGAGGLFATKAGILGMVLGGATIAAGVGVVYNFVGPSSKSVYSPELFQNSYYEEESNKASEARAGSRDASAAASSTLDMFKEQARKDGLGGLASEAGDSSASASADASAAGADGASASAEAAPAGAPGSENAGSFGNKLKASSGFGGGKGGSSGSGTSIPRMQTSAGLSGGIGAQFKPMTQNISGKSSAMTASAARVNSSPKYSVPNFNKKGAYGQAKYAGKLGAGAAYSADAAGARTEAASAFSGETSGSGDVGGAESGAGLGGAGVADGSKLKASDPTLSSNESAVPDVSDPTKDQPWQTVEDHAMYGALAALGLILITKILGKIAKTAPPVYYAAVATAIAAMAAAAYVAYQGFILMTKYGQKMMGGIYILTGAMLAIQAWNALCDLAGTTSTVNGVVTTTKGCSWLSGLLGKGIALSL